uniref:Ribosomal protein L7a n=1 Tax=Lotharella vacuolata TaxID=74820 RepID=A0A0H5BL92_9EUKA|nr:ribosomal protein L7a [Lotharella vacuolata]
MSCEIINNCYPKNFTIKNLKLIIENIKYYFSIINKNKNPLFKSKLKNKLYIKNTLFENSFIKTNKFDLFSYVAIVKITGKFNINPKIKKILELLKLQLPNSMTITKKNKAILHLLKKINNHIIWGEISKSVLLKLIMKKKENINLNLIKKIKKNLLKKKYCHKNDKNKIISNKKYTAFVTSILSNKLYLNFRLNSPSIHFSRKNSGKNTNTYVGYIGNVINNFLIKMM